MISRACGNPVRSLYNTHFLLNLSVSLSAMSERVMLNREYDALAKALKERYQKKNKDLQGGPPVKQLSPIINKMSVYVNTRLISIKQP